MLKLPTSDGNPRFPADSEMLCISISLKTPSPTADFMANGLLAGIGKKPANEFRKDLLGMLRVREELEKYYAESNQDFGPYFKKKLPTNPQI